MPEGGKVSLPVVPDFGGFSSLFAGGVRGALTEAEKFGKQISSALGGGVQAGVALIGAGVGIAVGDFVLQGVSKLQKLGAQTLELQHITGASAEQASLFAGVLAHVGENAEAASRGLGIFGAHIAQQPQLFAQFGVAIAKNADGTTNLLSTLDNLRKTLDATADSDNKLAIEKTLLGRSFLALNGYMHLSNDQLALFQRLSRESGAVIDQKTVDQTRELSIDMQEAKDKLQALQIALGRPIVGGSVNFASNLSNVPAVLGALSEAAHGDVSGLYQLATSHNKAGDAARQHAQDEVDAKKALDQMGVSAAAAETALKTLSSAGEGVRSSSEGLAKAQEGVATAARNVQRAQEGVAAAERGVATAHQNTQHAVESLTKAEHDLSKLLAAGPVDAKAVEQAQRGLDSANRSARDSTEALAAAEQHLAEVQRGASADDLTNARNQLTAANIALNEAKLAQAQPGNSGDPYAAQKAALSVSQATEARKQAQENLLKVQQQGTAADQNLVAAQKAVRDASQRVTDATTAQADAQKALTDAQAGDPDFLQKVADAKDTVARASEGVTSAQQGEADATRAVRDAQQAVVDAKQGQVDAAQAVQDAQYKLRDANYALQDAWDKAHDAGVATKLLLDELKQKYPELAAIIQQFYSDVNAAAFSGGGGDFGGHGASGGWSGASGKSSTIQRVVNDAENVVAALTGITIPHLAGGGAVVPGQAYLVGEQGPEILKDGRVYPSGQAPPAMGHDGAAMQPLILHVVLQDGTLIGRIDTGLKAKQKARS